MKVNFGSEVFSTMKVQTPQMYAQTMVQPEPEKKQPLQNGTASIQMSSQPQVDNFIPQKQKNNNLMDTILKYSGLVAVAAIPISAIFIHKGNAKQMDAMKKQLEETITKQMENAQVVVKEVQKDSKSFWKFIAGLAGGAGLITVIDNDSAKEAKDQAKEQIITDATSKIQTMQDESKGAVAAAQNAQNSAQNAQNTANDAINKANYTQVASQKGPLHAKYLEDFYGFQLLKGVDKKGGFNQQKYNAAIEDIKNISNAYLSGTAQKNKPPVKVGDTVWSVTSEFAPIKEGGLGAVPVDIQRNFEKLGIHTPTFIPMYQKNGLSNISEVNGKYTYYYDKTTFNLDKIAEMKIHSYKAHDSKDEPIEIFVSTSKIVNGKEEKTPPLVFIKNDEYFNGTVYAATAKSEETEKFAFFSKAVYEFAKAKMDNRSVKGLTIFNQEKFNEIKAPDALLLNDWQASPIAALARYKAPIENAYGVLNDEAKKLLYNMRVITIAHNATYQGQTDMGQDDAQRKELTENVLNTLFDNFASDIVRNADTKSPYGNLQNVLIFNRDENNRHTNFLNMGVCLSDYFAPVSKNYAKELIANTDKSGGLQWALETRDKNGTLIGIINGNDVPNIDIKAKKDFIDRNGKIDTQLYSASSSQEEIIEARAKNKINYYNNYIRPFNERKFSDPKSECVGDTKLPALSDEELRQTPILSFAHRLVSQKGVDIMVDSMSKLFANWEKDFGDKPKPIFYLAGEDGEGGYNRSMIENFKKSLNPEISNRIHFAHGYAPTPTFIATSDFFLMPSKFEPCGLAQSESFALGTPVIATATGGIVDTVISEGEGQTGILTKDISGEGFYNAMKEALKMFFDNKEKYNKIIMNDLHQDFSWVQPNRQGPIYDYLDKFGVDLQTLPEKSEIAA